MIHVNIDYIYYFDQPTVMSTRDMDEVCYIFVLLDVELGIYVGNKITEEQLRAFLDREIDLRSIYERDTSGVFYTGKFQGDHFTVTAERGIMKEEQLPMPGLMAPKKMRIEK
jgi:hypothetical protein